jgi:hypothetical protein
MARANKGGGRTRAGLTRVRDSITVGPIGPISVVASDDPMRPATNTAGPVARGIDTSCGALTASQRFREAMPFPVDLPTPQSPVLPGVVEKLDGLDPSIHDAEELGKTHGPFGQGGVVEHGGLIA